MIDFYMKYNTGLKWVEFENKNPIYGKSKVNPRNFLKNGFFFNSRRLSGKSQPWIRRTRSYFLKKLDSGT